MSASAMYQHRYGYSNAGAIGSYESLSDRVADEMFGAAAPEGATEVETADPASGLSGAEGTVNGVARAIQAIGVLLVVGGGIALIVDLLQGAKGKLKAVRRRLDRIEKKINRAERRGHTKRAGRLRTRAVRLRGRVEDLLERINDIEAKPEVTAAIEESQADALASTEMFGAARRRSKYGAARRRSKYGGRKC